jgi:hypothetical protein
MQRFAQGVNMSFKLFGRTFGKEGAADDETVHEEKSDEKPAASKTAKIRRMKKESKPIPKPTKARKNNRPSGKGKQRKAVTIVKPAQSVKKTPIATVKTVRKEPSSNTPEKVTAPVVDEGVREQDKDKELVVEKWEEDEEEDDLEKFADAPEETEDSESFDDIV